MTILLKNPLTSRLFRRAAVAITGLVGVSATTLYATWEELPGWIAGQPTPCPDSRPTAGVVFTGTRSRTVEGLRLFQQGKIDVMLISGNEWHTLRLKAQTPFSLFNETKQAAPGITIDEEASNTKENADNTAKWLASMPEMKVCAVQLITSAAHMLRSLLLLHRALEALHLDTPIRPHPIYDDMSHWRAKVPEIGKTLLTLMGIEERSKSAYLPQRAAASARRLDHLGQN
jgi:hypothetical protein